MIGSDWSPTKKEQGQLKLCIVFHMNFADSDFSCVQMVWEVLVHSQAAEV